MTLAEIYAAHFDFVWRNAARLGVPPHAVDDAVQDVFLVAHRRLSEFEGRSSMRTWLFGILRRVARDHRPKRRERVTDPAQLDDLAGQVAARQIESLAERQAAELVRSMLAELDDDKRDAFILVDMEHMSVPEAAEALNANLNTVYARIRAARAELSKSLARRQAEARRREPWNV
jgi:RNA polymerase sigma-70 factor (ECF subfamily)